MALIMCDFCGNLGNEDGESWPFIKDRTLPEGVGVNLCDDCWHDTQAEASQPCHHENATSRAVGGGESVLVCSNCAAVQYNDGSWAQ